jgi:hypothetical protein
VSQESENQWQKDSNIPTRLIDKLERQFLPHIPLSLSFYSTGIYRCKSTET